MLEYGFAGVSALKVRFWGVGLDVVAPQLRASCKIACPFKHSDVLAARCCTRMLPHERGATGHSPRSCTQSVAP